MATPDIALFVVGLLLFGGAAWGIIEIEGGVDGLADGGSSARVYNVRFTTAAAEAGRESAANLAAAEAVFTLADANVTRATIRVACSDPAGAAIPFTLTVEVAAPNGLAAEPASGACGQPIEIVIPVAAVPEATIAHGATEDEARADLEPAADATLAQGEWTVTVTGGRGPTGGLPVNPTNPGGTIVLELEKWEAEFSPVQR